MKYLFLIAALVYLAVLTISVIGSRRRRRPPH